jgi:hypothetical protein
MTSATHTIASTTPAAPVSSSASSSTARPRSHTPSTTPSRASATRWAGRILTGIPVAFLLFDGAIKIANIKAVGDAMPQLGWPTSLAVPLGVILLSCLALYVVPQTAVLGAILVTAYLGGAVATHVRIGNPLFSHILFPTYVGAMLWGGLYLRDARVRALIPFRRTNA